MQYNIYGREGKMCRQGDQWRQPPPNSTAQSTGHRAGGEVYRRQHGMIPAACPCPLCGYRYALRLASLLSFSRHFCPSRSFPRRLRSACHAIQAIPGPPHERPRRRHQRKRFRLIIALNYPFLILFNVLFLNFMKQNNLLFAVRT